MCTFVPSEDVYRYEGYEKNNTITCVYCMEY